MNFHNGLQAVMKFVNEKPRVIDVRIGIGAIVPKVKITKNG